MEPHSEWLWQNKKTPNQSFEPKKSTYNNLQTKTLTISPIQKQKEKNINLKFDTSFFLLQKVIHVSTPIVIVIVIISHFTS